MKTPATAADFARWEEKAAKMTDAELVWSIGDCAESAVACDTHDAVAAGRYTDEMCTYQDELNRRLSEVK